jgi:murein DD-endopeptidase MepM/ murein hydrolase activator NlpD
MLARCATLVLAVTGVVVAQTANAQTAGGPTKVKQGEVLRITADGAIARFNDKSIRLFAQPDGGKLGLMPIPVAQTPGTYKVAVLDSRGTLIRDIEIAVLDAHYPKQNIAASKAMKSLTPLPGEMDAVRALQNTVSDKRLWAEPFVTPTANCINSLFGVQRYHNGKPTGGFHRGLDLRSPMGTPVHAVTPGVVTISKMFRLHGGTIGIDHGQGVTSLYLHMSKLAVPEGTSVAKGDVVGYVGSTGFATGPHLHWQLSVNGAPVNPRQWIPDVPRCP